MSPAMVVGLLFLLMFIAFGFGVPVAFALGGAGVVVILFAWDPSALTLVALQAISKMANFAFLAIPLFIFTGIVLETAGLADDLFTMMFKWFGGIRGGLALGTVIICTIFAAMTGVSGAATVTMGIIALPAMLKRGYQKEISIGCISAGGALGILIPPSVTMVVYGLVAPESIGKQFAGGVFAGLTLSALFMAYVLIRCWLQPELGPAIPKEERANWGEKFKSVRAVIAPVFIIFCVLGTIFAGITSVSEAAAAGAVGVLICAAAYRRLTWDVLKETCFRTLRLTCMVMWIILGATGFSAYISASGVGHIIGDFVVGLEVNRWVIMIAIQLILVILGMIMETNGIIMVTVPIFVPIILALGFNGVWFAVLFIVNMEMGFLTPPFGYNLFYMKAVVPEGVTMLDIYKSIVPFVGLQAIGLALCMIFPEIILWLPRVLFGSV